MNITDSARSAARATRAVDPAVEAALQAGLHAVRRCGHPEWKDGYCAEMACHNYVNKRPGRSMQEG